ncbi:hypothetical protein Cob_v006775 [Colletotrichum orbiculare MAFF 240422]|uniref:Uncharacterized protein n=1 Tax=Colletotrichum orbiculare (strain 104-T / ATCC 96160 / CBS 514.97 / LARS 414 / MAFF 240422) TaxID=1213857 RepID=A0A484FSB6_COLOR|nr:hypothetical protein Cob_v006775 [Colletotrichum orbiculare MAFF 240422]
MENDLLRPNAQPAEAKYVVSQLQVHLWLGRDPPPALSAVWWPGPNPYANGKMLLANTETSWYRSGHQIVRVVMVLNKRRSGNEYKAAQICSGDDKGDTRDLAFPIETHQDRHRHTTSVPADTDGFPRWESSIVGSNMRLFAYFGCRQRSGTNIDDLTWPAVLRVKWTLPQPRPAADYG